VGLPYTDPPFPSGAGRDAARLDRHEVERETRQLRVPPTGTSGAHARKMEFCKRRSTPIRLATGFADAINTIDACRP
jgi:hypothetical protein